MIDTEKTQREKLMAAPMVRPITRSLSFKLLLFIIASVMIAEILIFIPSIANFRMRWLEGRLNTAAVAAVVVANQDSSTLSRMLQDDMLMATGAKVIALRDGEVSRLIAIDQMPPEVSRHIDLHNSGWVDAIADVMDTLVNGGGRYIRVFGPVAKSGKNVEIVIGDSGLRDALLIYARNVFFLSLAIALITAGLVFFAIRRMLIRPIQAMTRNMLAFSANPESPAGIVALQERGDEIGVAMAELAAMQTELRKTLQTRKHLADLGLAVSKINHDMRNMLAPAQLLSDRLASLDDPTVQKVAPRLLKALDRAVTFSESVMAYGKAGESEPHMRRIALKPLVDDVIGLLMPDENTSTVAMVNLVPAELELDADPEQMFRIIANLVRNALQALEAQDEAGSSPPRVTVSGGRVGSTVIIGVEDNGPGLPPKARENLFAAFKGSARAEGTGLGLAIAHELVTLHGGTIELRNDRPRGAHFEIRLPDQPVKIAEFKKRHTLANKAWPTQ